MARCSICTGIGAFPLGDQGVQSRAHPSATRSSKTDDYFAEALIGLPGLLQVIARRHSDDQQWQIQKYLDGVQRRVIKRRNNRGLPRTPNDPSWRRRFRDQVMTELRSTGSDRPSVKDT